MRADRFCWVVGVLLLASGGQALAQDAGTLLRQQQRQLEEQRREGPEPAAPVQPVAPPAPAPQAGPTIQVTQLSFVGKLELLPEAERQALADETVGRALGFAELQALAGRITALLQARGNLLARAYLPPQDVTDGVVRIALAEAALEAVELAPAPDVRVREDLLRALAERGIRPEAVRKQELESALLRMNDLPGVTARARLAPGGAPNSSRLVVGVEQAPLLDTQLWADNYGYDATGAVQGNGLLRLRDLTGFGDQLGLQATVSEGLTFGRLGASLPLWASGVTARASYSYLDYEIVSGSGRDAGLTGHSQQASAGLGYRILRSRDFNLTAGADVTWKALVDDSLAGRLDDTRVRSGALSLSGDWLDPAQGFTTWSLAWTYGELDLSRVPDAEAADAAGLDTQGGFHRVNLEATRLQDLPGAFALFGRFSGQWAGKNLDSSEEFSLGGPYGVRAYPVGEAQGDLGVLASLELRYDLPLGPRAGDLQFLGFVDGGHIWINEDPKGVPIPTATGRNDYGLAGAGLGVRWQRGEVGLEALWAHAIGSNAGRAADGTNVDGSTGSDVFWLQGSMRF